MFGLIHLVVVYHKVAFFARKISLNNSLPYTEYRIIPSMPDITIKSIG